MSRARLLLRDEDGSILPLAIGFVVIAASLIGVTVDLTSLVIAQKQADAIADAAAAAGADGFVFEMQGGVPIAKLDDAEVRAQAEAIVAAAPYEAVLISAETPDGTSARVTVSIVWRPPLLSLFVPDGVVLESTATGRTALQ